MKATSVDEKCACCGRNLPEGHLRYVVAINAFADFDGVLPEMREGLQAEIDRVLEEAEHMDSHDLEKDVHEEITFFLCKSCKDQFMDDPLHAEEGVIAKKERTPGLMH